MAPGERFGVVPGLGGGVFLEKLIEQGLALGVGEGGRIRGGGGGGDAVGVDEMEDGARGARTSLKCSRSRSVVDEGAGQAPLNGASD
jgi:hypothetical protein